MQAANDVTLSVDGGTAQSQALSGGQATFTVGSPEAGSHALHASYAATGNPLRSGVLIHEERLQGKAAAVEVEYGKGKVLLLGFKPQWRAQSHGTYKFVFNALYK